jgi:23S rRNA pseudouridine2605 synthase
MKNVKKTGRVPLERALSKLGIASRTEAKAFIEGGSVKVHGKLETDPKRMVNPDTAHIELEGKKAKKDASVLYLFHKPKGCLTTKRDPEGRPTIYDFIPPELHHLHAVGRLDLNTSGLLLLTNDTKLSNHLTDPENEVPRVYLVEVRGEFTESDQGKALQGVEDEGDLLKATAVKVLKKSNRESRIQLELKEGKNREIRRLCLALGHEVTMLIRISYGPHVLGDLKPGDLKIFNEKS